MSLMLTGKLFQI